MFETLLIFVAATLMASSVKVQTKFFLDDVEQTTQYGAGYTGAGFWLIIDLQMEGSSGSPGPTTGEYPRGSMHLWKTT